jgi:hypothetical protein
MVREWKTYVRVHENGVVWDQAGACQIIPWNRIAAVIDSQTDDKLHHLGHTVKVQTLRKCTLLLDDGKTVIFDHELRDINGLVATIQQESAPHLMERLRKDVSLKGNAFIGPVCLDRDGLTIKKEHYPWYTIQACREDSDGVVVFRDGAWVRIADNDTANVHVLVPLIEELRASRRGG